MKIVVFIAGTNDPSNAKTLADACIEGMQRIPGTEIERILVRDLDLDHFTFACYDSDYPEEEDFKRVKRVVQSSAGIVVATPVWNFSVPAHLKNLIDRMGSFGLDTETRSKGMLPGTPCFFIFTGGAPLAVWKGLMRFTTSHVGEAFRYFGASVTGRYYEGKALLGRGKFGLVVDKRPRSLEAVRNRGEKFAKLAKRIADTGKLPLSYILFGKAYRFGQKIIAKVF